MANVFSKPAEPFITKIIPPKRPFGLVRRERLVRALARAVDRHKIALLTAPAGYGKTSLIADFISDLSSPACWYSIDPEDNNPRAFLGYLVAAIRREYPSFGEGILQALNSTSDVAPLLPSLIGIFVSEIQRIRDWFPLVLEDLHCCDDPDILNALDLLLRHLPDNCFLVMSSRTRLPLGALSRLGAQRAVTRLNKSDLAFREAEVRELLQASGHNPDAAAANRLATDSEGWIAGIILLAPWLDQPTFEAALSTNANQEELFTYLADQVFDSLPDAWQQFLVQSAVLPDVEVALCEQAFGFEKVADLLQQMEAAGLLVTAVDSGAVYRYHALFRKFLLDRALKDHTRLRAWHRAAAAFFAAHDRLSEAVTFYLAARTPEEAVAVLVRSAADLYRRSEWAMLERLIHAIADQAGSTSVELELWRARCLVQLGDPERALAIADRSLSGDTPEMTPTIAAMRQIARSAALRSKGSLEDAMGAAESALQILDSERATPQVMLLRAEAHHYLGSCLATVGRNRPATLELNAALAIYQSLDSSAYHLARVHSNLGNVLYRMGDYSSAIASYEQSIDASRQLGNTAALAFTLNNLGNLYISIGSLDLAQDMLRSALEAARFSANLRLEAVATHSLGDSLAAAGHLDDAESTLMHALKLSRESSEAVLEVRVLLSLARCHARRRAFGSAESRLRQADRLAKAHPAKFNDGLLHFSNGLLSLLRDDLFEADRQFLVASEVFNQSDDLRWRERTALLRAEIAYQNEVFEDVGSFLEILRETAASDVGPAALRPEASLSQSVLRFAATSLLGGSAFARLCAAGAAWTETRMLQALAPKLHAIDKPVIRAYGLGSFCIELNGVVLDESSGLTSKARELLFYLLTTGKRARREELVEALWPDGETAKDSSVLRTNVYRLRKVLYDRCIVVRGDSYDVDPTGHFWYDLHYFKELLKRSRQPNCSLVERLMLLESAVKLYQGPFLEEVASDWCVAERYDMEIRYTSAALALATTHVANQDYLEAVEICERLLAIDAFNEDAVLLVVRSHLALGDRSTAMLHWRSFERRLQSEGGTSPSLQASSQYELLLRAS